MKTIPLSKSKVALVDDADFLYLSQWKWSCSSHGYAVRRTRKDEEFPSRIIYMHRVILNPLEDQEVDHANCDTLDNRRSNLRCCTSSQNKQNKRNRKDNTTGFKGIHRHQGGFRARIHLNGKSICLGVHGTPELAHAAYAEAAAKYFGEFARN